jgi:hypothetical protein
VEKEAKEEKYHLEITKRDPNHDLPVLACK